MPALVLAAAGFAAACGAATGPVRAGRRPSRSPFDLPQKVTADNFSKVLRLYRELPLDSPQRAPLRTRLVEHAAEQFQREPARRAAPRLFEEFATLLGVYEPEDVAAGRADAALGPMAEEIVRVYSPRGEEAKVLSALRVLTLIDSTDASARERYENLLRWTEQTRAFLPDPMERVAGAVEVYEEFLATLPDPEIGSRLVELLLERQGALSRLLATGGGPNLTFNEFQRYNLELARTAFDVLKVESQLGRPDRAIERLRPLRGSPGIDDRLIALIERQSAGDPAEMSRRLAASVFFHDEPQLALRLAYRGWRVSPGDPHFAALCGRLYGALGDLEAALDLFEAALGIRADDLETYDAALGTLDAWLRRSQREEDAADARRVFARTINLVEQYRHHWPNRQLPIDVSRVYREMGSVEFNAGAIDAAVGRLERSVEERPNKDALLKLGVIAQNRGDLRAALAHFRRALDLRPDEQAEEGYWRGLLLEHLADVHRAMGQDARGRQLFEEALTAWREAERTLTEDDDQAAMHLHRGLILAKLGRPVEAGAAFDRAITARPDRHDTYAQILAHLCAHGRLDEALAIYRRASSHTSADPYWRVYFALWIVGAQRRAQNTSDSIASQVLGEITGDGWQEKLAHYYAGTLGYAALLQSADSTGKRAEAFFYEAVNVLARNDRARAVALLRDVVATNMMGYFEYEMAVAILQDLHEPAVVPAANASAAAPRP